MFRRHPQTVVVPSTASNCNVLHDRDLDGVHGLHTAASEHLADSEGEGGESDRDDEVQYTVSTVQYSTVQYSTVQYSTIHY